MTEVVLAYVPVLHEGYRRFLERHARDRALHLIGPELHADYRPLAKDVRALPAADAAAAIAGWEIASSVAVLDIAGAEALATQDPSLILPAEDVSYQVVERFFPRAAVRYDPVFLRWDKSKTVQMLDPQPVASVAEDVLVAELEDAANGAAARSLDWWRQVGAALHFADGTLEVATNVHHPHELAPYAAGDPRSNFTQGRRAGAVDRHARRSGADRRRRPRGPRDRRRDDLRHRLPLPALREADRQRGRRQAVLPPRLRGPRWS